MYKSIYITNQKNKKIKLHIINENDSNMSYRFKNIKFNYSYLSGQKLIKDSQPYIRDCITNFELDRNKELVKCIIQNSEKIYPIISEGKIVYYKIPLYVYHHEYEYEQNKMKLRGYYYMSISNRSEVKFLVYKDFSKIFDGIFKNNK